MAELYNIKKDPGEANNLINDESLKPKIEELKKELESLMAAAGGNVNKMPIDEGIKKELPDKDIQ